ncbi:DUF1049 domain-containing protein [Aerococcaceae bacterium DSM 111176]|nr:DUF1049 domain-containing protein [Aerococcaceae bacterium DSM 111176]
MKNQAKLIFSILVLIIITVFAIQNTNNVQLDLIFVEFQTPLVLIILFSLLIGVIVGMIGTAVNNSSKRQEIKDLTKQVDKEKELRNRDIREKDTKIADLRAQLENEQLKQRNRAEIKTDTASANTDTNVEV